MWNTKRTRRAVGVAYIHTGGAVSIVNKAGGRGGLYPRANDSPEVWGDRYTIEKRVLLSAIKAERIGNHNILEVETIKPNYRIAGELCSHRRYSVYGRTTG